ncbi:MAG TPA: sugar phosphate isomerase/epimerase family protein [Pirellulales bacterium]|jgi:sugar phosphate isomerase/epimerase|nr:sugar phosphate isomerase/epimerase family protein [Pirellulales bacterium]
MSASATRRGFLGASMLAAAGLTGFAPKTSRAIEPIARSGKAKFKFSLAAYSYRDLLGGKSPRLTLADFIDDCAKMQLDGTELTSYYFPADTDDDDLRKLKLQAFRLGLDISGTAVGNDFCHPAGAERDKQLALVKLWVDRAEILGAPVIRIFSGSVKKDQTEAEARKLAIEGMEQCCEYAGKHGVVLALENHGGLTTTIEGLLSLVQDVKSPWFAVNLDSGNFRSSDPYADLARLAPYAMNVQIKVSMHPAGGKQEKADFKRLAKILGDAGYRGYIVLEFEEPEDPREACPRYLDEMRQAFA